MRKQNDKSFQKSLQAISEIVEARLASLPADVADSKRAEIHRVASIAEGGARAKKVPRYKRTPASEEAYYKKKPRV